MKICGFCTYEYKSEEYNKLATRSINSLFKNVDLKDIDIYCYCTETDIFKNLNIKYRNTNLKNYNYYNKSKYTNLLGIISSKLEILSELKKIYDVVFYFDLDIIFKKDFRKFLEQAKQNTVYGCVECTSNLTNNRINVLKDIGISANKYINVGFMIWTLNYEFNHIDYQEYILKPFVDCPEQDYINYKFKNHIKVLPNNISWNPLLERTYNPYMIHYLGKTKSFSYKGLY